MCHSLFCLLTAISMFRWKTSEPAEKSPDIKDAAILLFCVYFSTIVMSSVVSHSCREKEKDTGHDNMENVVHVYFSMCVCVHLILRQ